MTNSVHPSLSGGAPGALSPEELEEKVLCYKNAVDAVLAKVGDKVKSHVSAVKNETMKWIVRDVARQTALDGIYQKITDMLVVLISSGINVALAGAGNLITSNFVGSSSDSGTIFAGGARGALPGAGQSVAGLFVPDLGGVGGVLHDGPGDGGPSPEAGEGAYSGNLDILKETMSYTETIAQYAYQLLTEHEPTRKLLLIPFVVGYGATGGEDFFSDTNFRWFYEAQQILDLIEDDFFKGQTTDEDKDTRRKARKQVAQLRARAMYLAKRGFVRYVRNHRLVGHRTAAADTAFRTGHSSMGDTDMFRQAIPGDHALKQHMKDEFVDPLAGSALGNPSGGSRTRDQLEALFGMNHTGAMGSNNPLRRIGGVFHAEQGYSDTERARIETFISWFIIHKCFQIRTGTPLPLFLTPSAENADNVVRALLDILELAGLVPYFRKHVTQGGKKLEGGVDANRLCQALATLPMLHVMFNHQPTWPTQDEFLGAQNRARSSPACSVSRVPDDLSADWYQAFDEARAHELMQIKQAAPPDSKKQNEQMISFWKSHLCLAWDKFVRKDTRVTVETDLIETRRVGSDSAKVAKKLTEAYEDDTSKYLGGSWSSDDQAASINALRRGRSTVDKLKDKDLTDKWYVRKDVLDLFQGQFQLPARPPPPASPPPARAPVLTRTARRPLPPTSPPRRTPPPVLKTPMVQFAASHVLVEGTLPGGGSKSLRENLDKDFKAIRLRLKKDLG